MTALAMDVDGLIEGEANKMVRVREVDDGHAVEINLARIATLQDEQQANNRAETERQAMRMRLREFYARLKTSGHL